MDKQSSKRKRQSNGVDAPSKKVAVDANSAKIKVVYHDDEGLHPSLLSSPGLTAPTIPFTAYAKPLSTRHPANTTPKPTTHNILLHSAQHPRLDYTATRSALDQHQSHYIAVFDPATSTLQVSPAHHLSLRSVPRKISEDVLAQRQTQQRNLYQQREQLGQEFGTKKAKRAIASKTENAISKGPGNSNRSDAAAAVLESVADVAGATPNKAAAEQNLLASKPIPTPNLSAETVEEVYPINVLLPPSDARLVPVKDWQDKARAEEEFLLSHRYPSNRVKAIGQSEDVLKLKALGYLALLLEFHDALQGAGKTGKKVPKKEAFDKKTLLLAAKPRRFCSSALR